MAWAIGSTSAFINHGGELGVDFGYVDFSWTGTPTVLPTIIPPSVQPLPALSCSSDAQCTNGSKCVFGPNLCACAPGYLGALCQVVANSTMTLLADMLNLSYALDVENPQLTHFRLDSTQTNWMSLMVMGGTGSFSDLLAGDSATV